MTQKQLVLRLEVLRPGSQWNVTGDAMNALYSDLTWLDASPKPSPQELGL